MSPRRPSPVFLVIALLCASCSSDDSHARYLFRWHRRIPPERTAAAAEFIRSSAAAACANTRVENPEDVIAQLETTALQLFGAPVFEGQPLDANGWIAADPVPVSQLPLSIQGQAAAWASGAQTWTPAEILTPRQLDGRDPIPGLELRDMSAPRVK